MSETAEARHPGGEGGGTEAELHGRAEAQEIPGRSEMDEEEPHGALKS